VNISFSKCKCDALRYRMSCFPKPTIDLEEKMHTETLKLERGYSRFEGFDSFGSSFMAKIGDTMFPNARSVLVWTRNTQHMECGMPWKGFGLYVMRIVATTRARTLHKPCLRTRSQGGPAALTCLRAEVDICDEIIVETPQSSTCHRNIQSLRTSASESLSSWYRIRQT
jgi:hypothetical protein